jgi:hypothetical protein
LNARQQLTGPASCGAFSLIPAEDFVVIFAQTESFRRARRDTFLATGMNTHWIGSSNGQIDWRAA